MKLKKPIIFFIISLFVIFLIIFTYFFIGKAPQPEEINWGVNYSQKHASDLGLNWKAVYSSLIEDLGAKNIKLATYWDLIEYSKGEYNFDDLDWQIKKAEENDVKLLLAVGMKTPRWPECHFPEWAKFLNQRDQQKVILEYLEQVILKYKDSPSVVMWQLENEPFFPFGECPWVDKEFFEEELALVRSLSEKPIVITESGEFPLWIMAGKYADIVGVTMYKKVWVHQIGVYITYPFPSIFYHRKAEIVRKFFDKEVIGVELQAEPWGPKLLYDSPIEEQEKTMNLSQFKYNIEFAKKTGLSTHYLWGAEWWFWMKEKQNNSEIWEEARKLF